MKRFLVVALTAVMAMLPVIPAAAQQVVPPGDQSVLHRIGVQFNAPAYSGWRSQVISGNASTGASQSIIVRANKLTLNDGYTLPCNSTFCVPFNANTPIVVGAGSIAETVTPSSVSIGLCPNSNVFCATVTGTFNNLHGTSEPVTTGDSGIMEAETDAGWNGGGTVYWAVDTGNVTLATGGLTTTSTTKVPTQFISFGASARVETTITTSTNWAVGISGSTSAFCTANSTLTAGTTCIANMNSPAVVGSTAALTAILVTVTGANAGAGVVRVRTWGYSPVQSQI